MTLERRDDRLYYFRSVRDGESVRKVYVGAGDIARICSETDSGEPAEGRSESGRGLSWRGWRVWSPRSRSFRRRQRYSL